MPMAGLRDDQKHLVQQASDLVQLVGEQLALRPKGKEFVALCPFHDDKKPSMHVSQQKQIFKCFACGTGGDVFSWMMKYHKMTFPEALEHLAERAGIELKRGRNFGGQSQETKSERQRIGDANVKAMRFFNAQFCDAEVGRTARGYVAQRGMTDDIVEAFGIGYAPDEWGALANAVRVKGWQVADFELAGLVAKSQRGGEHYDRLRHRLIFPICDALGKPIAFGGRILEGSTRQDKSDAKYLNSPESVLFNKSATLYGLHLAKQAIIDTHTVVIVEGYTDVIACHQAEQCNVVATLGTALTAQHAKELAKFAEKVVLIFDGDEAGQKAADRAIEVFMTEQLDVHVAVLPGGQDPADLLAEPDGLDEWRQAIDHADDAMAYQFERVRGEFESASTMTGRQRVIEAYLRKLSDLGLDRIDDLRRSLVIERLTELLPLNQKQIEQQLKRFNRPQRNYAAPQANDQPDATPAQPKPVVVNAPRKIRNAERFIIGGLMREPKLFQLELRDGRALEEAIAPCDLATDAGQTLFEMLVHRFAEDAPLTLAALAADLAEAGRDDLTAWLFDVEAEADRATDGEPERLRDYVTGAAEAVAAYHRDREVEAGRDKLSGAEQADENLEPDETERLLKTFSEHCLTNPSPLRIGRVPTAHGSGSG